MLTSEAVGEVGKDGNVLLVQRIHVSYRLRVVSSKQVVALRAHDLHVESCPVARSIGGCVAITTSLEMEDLAEGPESATA